MEIEVHHIHTALKIESTIEGKITKYKFRNDQVWPGYASKAWFTHEISIFIGGNPRKSM